MYIVGITGGIGSGKSTLTKIFEKFEIEVVDADLIAREVLEKHPATLQNIVDHFGKSILRKNRELDRKALSNLVFADEKKRLWLEQLLHPLIADEARRQINKSRSPYTIYSAALLIENMMAQRAEKKHATHFIGPNRILVVDVPEEIQIQRASKRDQASREKIQAVIKAQVSREERVKHAHDVIDNSGDEDSLYEQCERLHMKYLVLSGEK